MNEVTKLYNQMLVNLEKGIDDVEKFEDGNKSAGTRVRKSMQEVKNLAQQIRVEVQEVKNAVTT
jgi:methyl-accepting chemotaxis protein